MEKKLTLVRSLQHLFKDIRLDLIFGTPRAVVERLIFDTLEKLLNPNYARDTRRNVNRLKRQTGQEYWWSP